MARVGAAVIFTSRRTSADAAGYQRAAARMLELVQQQTGYLGAAGHVEVLSPRKTAEKN